ncbi:MAG: SEC-C domain-containing protein, partial [Deltaproteobacteria bacterium]|nr:SEC-C domain-containing protein [Deltaproteobacteria bacterium]
MERTGPNDRCPCGSGKKFKKCCQSQRASTRCYARENRATGWSKLKLFIEKELSEEDEEAFDEFWGRWADHPDDLGEHHNEMSEHVFDLWFAFDRPLEDGRLVVDRFFDARVLDLSEGEKLYLRSLRASSMRLYEIEDLRPGESLTLRDVLEGERVTVQEKLGSRSLGQREWLVTRVVHGSASGMPELEGVFQIMAPFHESVRKQLRAHRDSFMEQSPGATVESFYKEMPPFFHDAWAGSILEPPVPTLANTDGEEMVITRVLFDVLAPEALTAALDKGPELSRDEPADGRWHWSGKNGKGDPVALGVLELREGSLSLEANSVARGERGRALVEGLAGGAVRHRATTHEDMQRKVREALRSGKPG